MRGLLSKGSRRRRGGDRRVALEDAGGGSKEEGRGRNKVQVVKAAMGGHRLLKVKMPPRLCGGSPCLTGPGRSD